MVVTDNDGVVKLFPVPTKFPPVEASYQFIVPILAVACKVNVPVSQRDAGVVLVIVGMATEVYATPVLIELQPLATASA